MMNLKKKINNKISELGFDVIGYTQPIVDTKTKMEYREFLKKKFHGQMGWLENHYEKKINPKKVWSEVKTIVVIGLNYAPRFNPLLKNDLKKKPILVFMPIKKIIMMSLVSSLKNLKIGYIQNIN